MNPEDIIKKALELQKQNIGLPAPSYSNYKRLILDYKQILNDVLVLTRELAKNMLPEEKK